jgi:hypothetical protein
MVLPFRSEAAVSGVIQSAGQPKQQKKLQSRCAEGTETLQLVAVRD